MKLIYCAVFLIGVSSYAQAQQATPPAAPPTSSTKSGGGTPARYRGVSAGGPRPMSAQEKEEFRVKNEQSAAIGRRIDELEAKGDFDGAIAECRKLPALFPESGDLGAVIGEIQTRQGKLDQAIASFKTSLPGSPARAYEGLAVALDLAGRDAEAIAAYRQVVYRDPSRDWITENGQSLKAMVEPDGPVWNTSRSNDPDFLMRYALLLSKTGQYAEALQVYEWGLVQVYRDQKPFFPLRMTVQTFDARLFEASAHMVLGLTNRDKLDRDGTALAEYRKALALSPHYGAAYLCMGYTYLSMGKYDDTKIALQKAIQWGRGEVREKAQYQIERVPYMAPRPQGEPIPNPGENKSETLVP